MSAAVLLLAASVGGAAFAGHGPPARDTVLPLRGAGWVEVRGFSGELVVRAWDGGGVEVRSDDGRPPRVGRGDGTLRIGPSRGGGDGETRVRVPHGVGVRIGGRDLEADVEGVSGGVEIRVLEGEVRGRSLQGRVEVALVDGPVALEDVRGSVTVRAQDGDVSLAGVEGEVDVRSGEGDAWLTDLDLSRLHLETLDGDVTLQGRLAAPGPHAVWVHDGDVSLDLEGGSDLDVSIRTYDGELHTPLPVRIARDGRGQVFRLRLGEGGTALEVEVFDGEITVNGAAGGR